MTVTKVFPVAEVRVTEVVATVSCAENRVPMAGVPVVGTVRLTYAVLVPVGAAFK
jgi:hypothetical protein